MDISSFITQLETWQDQQRQLQETNESLRFELLSQQTKINELKTQLHETKRSNEYLTGKCSALETQIKELKSDKARREPLSVKDPNVITQISKPKMKSYFETTDENIKFNDNITIRRFDNLNNKQTSSFKIKPDTIGKLLNKSDLSQSTPLIPWNDQEKDLEAAYENEDPIRELLIPTQYTLDSNDTRYEEEEEEENDVDQDNNMINELPVSQELPNENEDDEVKYSQILKFEDSQQVIPKVETYDSDEKVVKYEDYEWIKKEESQSNHKEEEEEEEDSFEVEDSQFHEEDTFFESNFKSSSNMKPFNNSVKDLFTMAQHINNKPPTFSDPILPLVTSRVGNIANKKHQLEQPNILDIKRSKTPHDPNKNYNLTTNPETNQQWSLQDFAINPSRNDNLNYAYGETSAQRKYSKTTAEIWKDPKEYLGFGQFDIIDQDPNKVRQIDIIIMQRLMDSVKGENTGRFVFKEKRFRDIVDSGKWFVDWDYINKIIVGSK